jgi:ArsR family transcriptional regulator, arsenate/arsenite/antimonite-responsive transcriptional repressor / arsenate reductase (thioredoxin)
LTAIDYSTIIESMTIDLLPPGGEDGAERRARVHAALGDPARLSIVDRLLLADASPSELQGLLSMPSNLVAHHLRILEEAGVVQRSRSEADRRRTYLQLVPGALEAALPTANWRAQRVVFVCSHNSARSPLAVAIWNRRSTMPAASAGTHPATKVQPGAIKAAKRSGLVMPSHTPVHIDDVVRAGDLVVAVCDNAHEELAPDPRRLHWSVPDPAGSEASDAFDRAVDTLTERIDRLLPALRAG